MLITHSTFQVFNIQYILSKARPKALALFVKVKKVRLILLDYILLFSPHLGEGYKLRILRGELASAVLLYTILHLLDSLPSSPPWVLAILR